MTVQRVPGPPRITCTDNVQGGDPCIDGTRVQAWQLLACINGGDSPADIYQDYPRIPYGSIEAVIAWAQDNGLEVSVSDRRMPQRRAG